VYWSDDTGVNKFANVLNGTAELTFGNSGPGELSAPCALALGPDDTIYALDTSQNRIVRCDSTDGSLLGSFPLDGATDPNALAVTPNGQVYTANGDGGGSVYNGLTGALLDTFTATTAYTGNATGDTALMVENSGLIYLADATGTHTFFDDSVAAPEPSSICLMAFGLAGLAIFRRRSSARPNQSHRLRNTSSPQRASRQAFSPNPLRVPSHGHRPSPPSNSGPAFL
jgi:outer membrane protein assembly factor BamB